MDFNFTELAIGGVALVYLIPRLVEFAKVNGLKGQRDIWLLAFGLGFVFSGLAAAMGEGLVPPGMLPWIRVVAVAMGGAVAACAAIGDYELNHKQ